MATAQHSEPGLTADRLLRRADTAMYAGKRNGKGVLVHFHNGYSDGLGDPDLPNVLAHALAGDPAEAGFDVYYQPIVRIDDGSVVAVEALARWSHPGVGSIEPRVFVAVAERAGLVGVLDDFVLNRACRDAAALLRGYGHPIDIHVNVCADRLGTAELEESVVGALSRHGMPADHLVLEITETSRIKDVVSAAAAGYRLRDRGIRLALDDFGAGFNALAELHALPVDVVKLDAAITAVEADGVRAAALCRSLLTICSGLRAVVVAEGVENAARAEALAALGCHLGQGYFYGPPATLPELTAQPPVPPHPPRRASHAPSA